MILLRNVRLIPQLTPGFSGERGDVLIQDKHIKAIVPPGEGQAEHAVDLSGCTLLPGLIDAHVHLDLCGMNTFEENTQPDSYRTLRALSLAQSSLRQGYTTLRDLGDRNNVILSLARAIEEGLCQGPSLLASGRILSPTEAGNEFFGSMYRQADSPKEFRRGVRKQHQAGAKWIKVMVTGAVMNPGGEPGQPILLEKELQALVQAARRLSLPVAAHCHGAEGIKMAIKAGVRTVEHSTLMDKECIALYQKAAGRVFPIPTLSPLFRFSRFPQGQPAHYVEKANRYRDAMVSSLALAKEAGIKMGFGTDAGVYEGSHGNGIYEFRCRVEEAGFTPLECLLQATLHNAQILGIDHLVGTIEPGKWADLVAFPGQPDLQIDHLEKPAFVMKQGCIVPLS